MTALPLNAWLRRSNAWLAIKFLAPSLLSRMGCDIDKIRGDNEKSSLSKLVSSVLKKSNAIPVKLHLLTWRFLLRGHSQLAFASKKSISDPLPVGSDEICWLRPTCLAIPESSEERAQGLLQRPFLFLPAPG